MVLVVGILISVILGCTSHLSCTEEVLISLQMNMN
jgi:hypothetical protein